MLTPPSIIIHIIIIISVTTDLERANPSPIDKNNKIMFIVVNFVSEKFHQFVISLKRCHKVSVCTWIQSLHEYLAYLRINRYVDVDRYNMRYLPYLLTMSANEYLMSHSNHNKNSTFKGNTTEYNMRICPNKSILL